MTEGQKQIRELQRGILMMITWPLVAVFVIMLSAYLVECVI